MPDRAERFKAAAELYRSSAKWLIAAFGAIGAVLVAGIQLSSIGSLELASSRFAIAVSGLVASLGGIGIAIWCVAYILEPREWEFPNLIADWAALDPSRWDTYGPIKRWRLRHRYYVVDYFRRNPEQLWGEQSPQALLDKWNTAHTQGMRAQWQLAMDDVLERSTYESLQRDSKRVRWVIAGSVVMAAIGIGFFAWASNPPSRGPSSLRNASLRGADLHGANLKNADLTDADLTGANLRGAQMSGANIAGVIWAHTICPDGTNSDQTRRADSADSGTCADHLSP